MLHGRLNLKALIEFIFEVVKTLLVNHAVGICHDKSLQDAHENPLIANHTVGVRGPSPLHNIVTPLIANHSIFFTGVSS
jgi:hypothetical protein